MSPRNRSTIRVDDRLVDREVLCESQRLENRPLANFDPLETSSQVFARTLQHVAQGKCRGQRVVVRLNAAHATSNRPQCRRLSKTRPHSFADDENEGGTIVRRAGIAGRERSARDKRLCLLEIIETRLASALIAGFVRIGPDWQNFADKTLAGTRRLRSHKGMKGHSILPHAADPEAPSHAFERFDSGVVYQSRANESWDQVGSTRSSHPPRRGRNGLDTARNDGPSLPSPDLPDRSQYGVKSRSALTVDSISRASLSQPRSKRDQPRYIADLSCIADDHLVHIVCVEMSVFEATTYDRRREIGDATPAMQGAHPPKRSTPRRHEKSWSKRHGKSHQDQRTRSQRNICSKTAARP